MVNPEEFIYSKLLQDGDGAASKVLTSLALSQPGGHRTAMGEKGVTLGCVVCVGVGGFLVTETHPLISGHPRLQPPARAGPCHTVCEAVILTRYQDRGGDWGWGERGERFASGSSGT